MSSQARSRFVDRYLLVDASTRYILMEGEADSRQTALGMLPIRKLMNVLSAEWTSATQYRLSRPADVPDRNEVMNQIS